MCLASFFHCLRLATVKFFYDTAAFINCYIQQYYTSLNFSTSFYIFTYHFDHWMLNVEYFRWILCRWVARPNFLYILNVVILNMSCVARHLNNLAYFPKLPGLSRLIYSFFFTGLSASTFYLKLSVKEWVLQVKR